MSEKLPYLEKKLWHQIKDHGLINENSFLLGFYCLPRIIQYKLRPLEAVIGVILWGVIVYKAQT